MKKKIINISDKLANKIYNLCATIYSWRINASPLAKEIMEELQKEKEKEKENSISKEI